MRAQVSGFSSAMDKQQVVFGALAASAAAVNVALQFISNAGSLTGSIGGDSSASRKRKHEEDDDSYMPALIASMADDEAIARLGEYISHTRVNTWWEEFRASDDPNPERWITNFRVSKSTFDYICNLVKPDLESATPANFMNIEVALSLLRSRCQNPCSPTSFSVVLFNISNNFISSVVII